MKLRHPLLLQWIGLLGASAIRAWMQTLDYRVKFYDQAVDPVHPDCQGTRIYVFWHEYILIPIHLRGHCNLAMLLSQHADAELLGRAARHLGFSLVRGSSYRGGASALRELAEKSAEMNLTITPDGPRGPRRRLAQGPIYLASRLQLPLVCLGLGYDRPWRLNSWDRFALPRPYSRARGVIGPELRLPADLDRDGIEHYRQHVEHLLTGLTVEAENWAASGRSRLDEEPARREHRQSRCRRGPALPPPLDPQPANESAAFERAA